MKKIYRLLLLMPCLLLMGNGFAASFDCAKVKTEIEKTICTHPELSLLDERLGTLYPTASQAGNIGPSKIQQQNWLLNIRNACHQTSCLREAYQQRIAELSAANNSWTLFKDVQLGIEFSYPGSRKIRNFCHETKNCIALVAPSMPLNTDYLLAFEVFEGNWDQIAIDHAVFAKNGKNWIAKGRSGEYPAELLHGDGWEGIKAVIDCGVSDENGFHAAGGECLWAVLSNGKRSLVIDTQGLIGNDESSLHTIQSVRFLN